MRLEFVLEEKFYNLEQGASLYDEMMAFLFYLSDAFPEVTALSPDTDIRKMVLSERVTHTLLEESTVQEINQFLS